MHTFRPRVFPRATQGGCGHTRYAWPGARLLLARQCLSATSLDRDAGLAPLIARREETPLRSARRLLAWIIVGCGVIQIGWRGLSPLRGGPLAQHPFGRGFGTPGVWCLFLRFFFGRTRESKRCRGRCGSALSRCKQGGVTLV